MHHREDGHNVLGHERAFMGEQLLKGVHVHLAGRGQHGSVDVS